MLVDNEDKEKAKDILQIGFISSKEETEGPVNDVKKINGESKS